MAGPPERLRRGKTLAICQHLWYTDREVWALAPKVEIRLQNLIVSFNAIAPLFLLIIIGFFIRQKGLLRSDALPQLNSLAFTIFLPALLFNNLYTTNVESAFSPRLIGYAVFAALTMYGLAVAVVCLLEKDSKNRGAMIQAIYRSNFVLLGLPIVQTLFAGQDLGATSVVVAVIVPIFNVLAVVTLEVFRGSRVKWGKVLLGIIKNPLIIASLLGFCCMLLGITLPTFLHTAVVDLSKAATPVSLVVLGASIQLSAFGRQYAQSGHLCAGAPGRRTADFCDRRRAIGLSRHRTGHAARHAGRADGCQLVHYGAADGTATASLPLRPWS